MAEIKFSINLVSDGEPGSGFGTEMVDSLLPRNIDNKIIIPAAHIKGLLTENLRYFFSTFFAPEIIDTLCGNGGPGSASLFYISDAVSGKEEGLTVSRTSLNDFGVAADGSLRTSEAIAAGTVFKGSIRTPKGLHPSCVDMLRLGLLSITAIGGGRNRGAGACFIEIEGCKDKPGDLLKKTAGAALTVDQMLSRNEKPVTVKGSSQPVLLQLTFTAESPVCVPETPVVKNNMIRSGFAIPASAVQGAVLHRLNDMLPELATACYQSEAFRAWPLLPFADDKDMPVRVSFTHKISKLKNNDGIYHFSDEMIEAYDWKNLPRNAPLKSSDGVLLANPSGVKLWKSGDMARIITAHGVHNNPADITDDEGGYRRRNLYTIEAMAPGRFRGLLLLPEDAAQVLLDTLAAEPFIQLGKSRSVRGGGVLKAEKISFDTFDFWRNCRKGTTFIVQSPVLVPEHCTGLPVEAIMAELVKAQGLGEIGQCSGSLITLFGWNRHNDNPFRGARLALAPGAVFTLHKPVSDFAEAMRKGLGEGRQDGFGSILPHPGIAKDKHEPKSERNTRPAARNFALDGYNFYKKALSHELSASQISRVRALCELDGSGSKALQYLQRQKTDRPDRIWDRWKSVIDDLVTMIGNDPGYTAKVLKVCQDLLVAKKAN